MKALVTGATGLIGRRLILRLDDAVVLSRDPDLACAVLGEKATYFPWSPNEPPPSEAFVDVDAVFHLAGEPVADRRWTAEKKQAIRTSRVEGTQNLVSALSRLENRPSVLVSASAVGYFGDRGDEVLDESSASGRDFLASVCAEWEAAARLVEDLGIRVVSPRIGMVLSTQGGALARMLPLFRLGLGGQLGDGRQWVPWIHLDDVVGLLLHAATCESVTGPMNAVSPNPVTNGVFTKALAGALKRPARLPLPRIALKTAFGELSEILLASQRVLPRSAQKTGYQFQYENLPSALAACLETSSSFTAHGQRYPG